MTAVATVTTLQQASVGIVGKPTGSTGRFSSVLTDAQVRALLGTGSGGLGTKYLADDSTWKAIDLSGYVPYTGATADVNIGSNKLVGSSQLQITATDGIKNVYISGATTGTASVIINEMNLNCGPSIPITWSSSVASTPDLYLYRGGAGILQRRNGLNPQTDQLFSTYTSATSFACLDQRANAGGTAYEISSFKGSAGGSNLPINIGHRDSAGTFTSALSVDVSRRCYLYGENYVTNNYSNTNIFTTDSQAINKGGKLGLGGVFTGTTPVEFAMISGRKESGTSGDPSGYFQVGVTNSLGAMVEQFRISSTGLATFAGAITASGTINGRASTTAAATAPIKLPTGVLMTTPEAGAIEYDGTNLYFTDSGGTRRQLQVV